MEVSKEQFYYWKQHPVTVEIFKKLQWAKEMAKQDMSDEVIIRSDNCQLILHEKLGALNAIAEILNIEYEDLIIPEKAEEKEDVNIF